MAANVESMFSVGREAPWHGLGELVEQAPNSEQALILAGLNWNVESKPVHVGGIEVPNYVANVRDSDNSVLGICSERYKIVQNRDAFSFTDELIRNSDGDIRYETAGSLAGGKRVWLLARMPEVDVVGDKTTPFLVFTNSHDGKGSIKVCLTPIRVVCQNTLNLALDTANRSWSAIHIGDLQSKMDEAKITLGLAQEYMQELAGEAEKLANIKLTDNDVADYIKLLLPIPDKASDRQRDNIRELQTGLARRYLQAEDITKFRGTGWGFINAVSDFATHSTPLRATNTHKNRLFEKTINGNPLIDKAYDLLIAA